MGTEFHAMGLDFADFGEAEDLETAAVREDGQGPVHESMETAGGLDDLHARADGEVVGVAEENLRAHFEQFAGVQSLDTGLGADRHEDRGVDDATGGRESSQAGAGSGIRFQ